MPQYKGPAGPPDDSFSFRAGTGKHPPNSVPAIRLLGGDVRLTWRDRLLALLTGRLRVECAIFPARTTDQ